MTEKDSNQRPSWVVLAPGKRAALEPEILRRCGGDEDDPCEWEIVDGSAGYIAIVDYTPGADGGGEDLAMALSRGARKPVYALSPDMDYPRVVVFVDGAEVGDVKDWPDSVAVHLGCRIRGLDQDDDGDALVDLTPIAFPKRKPGEATIAGWTVAELTHMIEHETDWKLLLEGAGEERAGEAVDALDNPDATVRRLACELVDGFGIYELRGRAPGAVERLRVLARNDPDDGVRAAAQEAHDTLAESLERRANQKG